MKQKSQIANLPNEQKEIIKGFYDETLKSIYQNRKVALKYALAGILQTNSERDVEEIADYMQILARTMLEERGILRKS